MYQTDQMTVIYNILYIFKQQQDTEWGHRE